VLCRGSSRAGAVSLGAYGAPWAPMLVGRWKSRYMYHNSRLDLKEI
jgi:hypothetical protein